MQALALHGGEDYQLLLAVAPEELGELSELARVWDVEVTAVGEFVAGEAVVRLRDGGLERPLARGGHDHFRPGPAGEADLPRLAPPHGAVLLQVDDKPRASRSPSGSGS